MHFVTSLLIFIFLCMHACTARHLPLFEKDFPQQTFPAKMAKVVSFKTNQEDSTNGNKNMVERSDHNQDEDSVNVFNAAKENDTSQKEKTEDHRGSEIDVSLSRKRIDGLMSPNRIDQSTSQAVKPNAKQVLPEGSKSRRPHEDEEALHKGVKERPVVLEMDYNPPQRKSPIHNK
ncbi:hypothetical protein POM88_009505 [Heracleum sosnowskyi]|uniref:Uncharacterized protein n=1 Tax=Heracleum sosnowskyi TaxID=360622 RepID=A0AAD8JC18_9APIA|nr:hypothetical protein POM88_009505 [Heracleum sosnowskyi]